MSDLPVALPPAVMASRAALDRLRPEELARLRRRTIWVLFAAVALGSTGYIAAVTVGTLAAAEIGGTEGFGGLPSAAAVLGTALAAAALSRLMLRTGRRPGLLAGLSVGAIGAVVAVLAILVSSLPLLLLGSAMAGFANGASQLSRYVAADMYGPERRASAIGTVVWGATIGAVIGPNLVAPAGVLAESLALPPLSGGYIITAGFSLVAVALAIVLLRPEPYALADLGAMAGPKAGEPTRGTTSLLASPTVLVPLVTLIAGQVVMVLIMTMTPLHIRQHGHGLETVGFVLSAHIAGMFAFSPLSGRLTDRFGAPPVIGGGLLTLAIAAAMAAVAPPDGGLVLTLALFLLGFGWSLGFVAGSTMLTSGLDLVERTRVQGAVDPIVWSSAAIASLASGVVVALASYAVLGLLGVALLVPPAVMLLTRGRGLSPARG